jgi:uncharacterized protein with HEPN domain
VTPALRDRDILGHIVLAATKLLRFTAGRSEAAFMADEVLQDDAIRNLEVIGEAVTKSSSELKALHADVPWAEIAVV